MEPITIRGARRADKEALARIHAEVARYYLDLAPDYFQVLERFAEQLDTEAPAIGRATLHLVAEVEGQVVGALVARLLPPEDAAKREISRAWSDESADRVSRRRGGEPPARGRCPPCRSSGGLGTAAGATIAETTTYRGSPLSVSFWGERMSYEELSVNLRKPL